MITYQLDECTNSKKLAESCSRQGLVEVRRWPGRRKGQKNPEWLPDMLASGGTLLTTDREIHFQHVAHIPSTHSGILIVAKTQSATTIRREDVMRILAQFKSAFPEWHCLSLRNSIVEICETHIQLWWVESGKRVTAVVRHSDPGWQTDLLGLLQRNARIEAPTDEN